MGAFSLLFGLLSLSTVAKGVVGIEFSPIIPRIPQTNPASLDATCGSRSTVNATCLGSVHGNCCSQRGFCGSTSAYCQEGCQPGFGTCETSDGSLSVSTSGNCGIVGGFDLTCRGSSFGDCCSTLGYCGRNSDYCGTGCQSKYGNCESSGGNEETSVTVSTSSAPSSARSSPTSRTSTRSSQLVVSSTAPVTASEVSPSAILSLALSNTPIETQSKTASSGLATQADLNTATSKNTNSIATSSPTAKGQPERQDTATSGLSSGARAGIGIGIVLAAIIAIVLAFFFWRRRNLGKGKGPFELSGENSVVKEFYDPKSTALLEQDRGNYFEMDTKKYAEPVELPAHSKEEAARKERERIARVDARAAAGYDGAYRGN